MRNPNIEPDNVAKLMQTVFPRSISIFEECQQLPVSCSMDWCRHFVSISLASPSVSHLGQSNRKVSGTKSHKSLIHTFFHYSTYIFLHICVAFLFFFLFIYFLIKKHYMSKMLILVIHLWNDAKHTKYNLFLRCFFSIHIEIFSFQITSSVSKI